MHALALHRDLARRVAQDPREAPLECALIMTLLEALSTTDSVGLAMFAHSE
jgi:hypothetical protein